MRVALLLIAISLVSGCFSTGRYQQRQDSAPKRLPQQISSADAEPHYVPYTPKGNAPYVVFGRHYTPMRDGKDYSAVGEASWYGQKFHGHLTSNGETYNMYAMSAAHKTLPLPSFVRVTNLANDKQVVVRVNDRGPFHGGRLIDLSYAAARKLDMLKTGVAKVKLDVVHVDEQGVVHVAGEPKPPLKSPDNKQLYIQVAALQNRQQIEKMAQGLAMLFQVPTKMPNENGIVKLRLGPIDDEQQAQVLLQELKQNGYEQAYALYSLE